MRTRVCRTRRNRDGWEWFMFDGDSGDHATGFDSEREARTALAQELSRHLAWVDQQETTRQFMRGAFAESGGNR